MKILFCGDRNYSDTGRVLVVMTLMRRSLGDFTVIEGEARGADTIARMSAEQMELPVLKFPADWNKNGRAAGPIRNVKMLAEEPDAVMAFHDNISESRGTKHMVEIARKKGIPVWLPEDGFIGVRKVINAVKGKKV